MMLVKRKNGSNAPVLSDVFDSFFNNNLTNFGSLFNQSQLALPAVNIRETGEEYLLEIAAPGLKKDDFHIDLDNDLLTVSFEKENENEETLNRYTQREFNFQSFKRTFTLPQTVMGEKISARYNDGILSVMLPKKEEAKKTATRRIKIS